MAETKKTEDPQPQIQLTGLESETLLIPIIGTSPLIIHKFSEKAKKAMLDAMQGRIGARQRRAATESAGRDRAGTLSPPASHPRAGRQRMA